MSGMQVITSLIQVTNRLTEIISAENEILVTRRPRALVETQVEKERLTIEYERKMMEFNKQPELLARLQPNDVDRLKKATSSFQDALDDHRRLVQTAKSVTERMLKAITDEVGKKKNPTTVYNQNAVTKNGFMSAGKPRVSIALNQVI